MRPQPDQGDRVCSVRMDGCMAHVRGPEMWGVVEQLTHKRVIGSDHPLEVVVVRFDDGSSETFVRCDFFAKDNHFERQY